MALRAKSCFFLSLVVARPRSYFVLLKKKFSFVVRNVTNQAKNFDLAVVDKRTSRE